MSSLSLIVAGAGAVAAAVGSGVLLARCFRAWRPDLVAWSIALIGLLISLGSQTLGYLAGFDGAMFRAMELGAQVIAPMALVLALCEVAGRSLAARFCARVYIPSIAIVAAVILTLDQLAAVTFTKAWPDPAVYYEAPPKYILMFAIGPVTALITVVAVASVIVRSGGPGWNAVLPAQLAAGAAALLLAYPALALLVSFGTGVNLPVRPVFSLFCAAAAGLIWYAGVATSRLRLGALHGAQPAGSGARAGRAAADGWERDGRPDHDDAEGIDRNDDFRGGVSERAGGQAGRWDDYDPRDGYDRSHGLDHTGDIDRYGAGGGQGYAGDGRAEGPDDDPGYGWQTRGERYGDPDGARSSAGERDGDFQTGDFEAGDYDRGHDPANWSDLPGPGGAQPYESELAASGHLDSRADWQDGSGRKDWPAGSGRAGEDRARADLFGQIAIYTLLEDRVDDFDQLTERVVDQVRSSEPETLVFIVHAVPSAPMQRILYEVYRDRDAYERHRQQPYIARFEADRRPYVLATNVIELGLQQAKVSPFPSVAELFGEPGYDTSGFERPDYLRDYGRPPAQDGPARSW